MIANAYFYNRPLYYLNTLNTGFPIVITGLLYIIYVDLLVVRSWQWFYILSYFNSNPSWKYYWTVEWYRVRSLR